MPPVTSATAHSTSDGRIRLSSAAASAASPNACGVNSAMAVRRLAHSQLSRPLPQAMPTDDCSITA